MNASEYQVKAHDFASYGENPMYPALGLAEEAGEVCGKIAKMSDAYLDELMRVTYAEHVLLDREVMRRKSKKTTLIARFPCTLQELETAVHSYGDHYGFHGRVVVFPMADAGSVNTGIGVEEQE